MGPEFFAAPTKNEWDGETCTSPFMENVLWEQGTEPGYITGPNGTAGTVLVGGAGVIQQGLGRDHPFSIGMSSTQKNWDAKGITDKDSFNLISSSLQILRIGFMKNKKVWYAFD